jgi:t-SNARE complex subunit (syntaxin)
MMEPGGPGSTPSNTIFFSLASDTQALMATLLLNIEQLSRERCKLYTITTSEEEAQSVLGMQVCTQTINEGLGQIRDALQELQELSIENKDTSDSRIRLNVCNTLVRRFRHAILKFQKEQSEIADAKRSRAVRLLQISAPGKLTTEEAESLVVEGVTHEMAMMDRMSNTDMDLNWVVVRERVRDLHALEQSISDLSQMFQEMATLTDHQGDVLDSIEFAVVNVKNFNNLSSKSLQIAKKKQRSNMKLVLYIALTCIILAVVIIIPILFTDALHKIFNGAKQQQR